MELADEISGKLIFALPGSDFVSAVASGLAGAAAGVAACGGIDAGFPGAEGTVGCAAATALFSNPASTRAARTPAS